MTGRGSESHMAVVRHCAMNIVRGADDEHSLKVRRKKASLELACLAKLLAAQAPST